MSAYLYLLFFKGGTIILVKKPNLKASAFHKGPDGWPGIRKQQKRSVWYV